jgi:hypothetical protein
MKDLRPLLPVALLLVSFPSHAAPVALSVTEVIARHRELNGRQVIVRGWLDRCRTLSCGLFASRKAAVIHRYGDDMLSIGWSKAFDRELLNRGPVEILLRARVNDTCMRPEIICLDRADELQPIKILRVWRR